MEVTKGLPRARFHGFSLPIRGPVAGYFYPRTCWLARVPWPVTTKQHFRKSSLNRTLSTEGRVGHMHPVWVAELGKRPRRGSGGWGWAVGISSHPAPFRGALASSSHKTAGVISVGRRPLKRGVLGGEDGDRSAEEVMWPRRRPQDLGESQRAAAWQR